MNNQKITIRYRPLKDKRKKSVFLDYAPPIPHPKKNGKTKRFQFLNEWIYSSPTTPNEKQHNFDVIGRCQKIQSKLINEFKKQDIYNPFEIEQLKIQKNQSINFIDEMKRQCKQKGSLSNKDIYNSAMKYLIAFNGGSDELLLKNITRNFVEDFREYLLNTKTLNSKERKLGKTSASHYFQKFISVLSYTFNKGLITEPLHKHGKPIDKEKTLPVYLTENEIQLLIKNPCKDDVLYRTTLFMILTGLRISDVLKLKWSNLFNEDDKHYLRITIQKQKEPIQQYINTQALELLGEAGDSEYIFNDLNENKHNLELTKWCNDVGIGKTITWHKLRHTFAVQMLKRTGNIFLLQKLMHHKDIKSTMVYAHVIEEEKNKATDGFTLDNL